MTRLGTSVDHIKVPCIRSYCQTKHILGKPAVDSKVTVLCTALSVNTVIITLSLNTVIITLSLSISKNQSHRTRRSGATAVSTTVYVRAVRH